MFVNLNCSCSLTLEAIFKDSGRQKDNTAFLKVIQVVLGLGHAFEELSRGNKLLSYSTHHAPKTSLRPSAFKPDWNEETPYVMMPAALPRVATVASKLMPTWVLQLQNFKIQMVTK